MNEYLSKKSRQVAILRSIVLVTGIYQIIHEPAVGLAILASLVAISFPSFVSRGRIKSLPIEFEVILFVMVILQFVVGETLNFYENVPYFDKFVHFTLPFFLGYIASIIAYTMHVNGLLRTGPVSTLFITVMFTLGIGSIWEIFEYLCDVFLGTYFQGSLTASPIVDTMNDLIVDLLGGVFGALIAVRNIHKEENMSSPRLSNLVKQVKDMV